MLELVWVCEHRLEDFHIQFLEGDSWRAGQRAVESSAQNLNAWVEEEDQKREGARLEEIWLAVRYQARIIPNSWVGTPFNAFSGRRYEDKREGKAERACCCENEPELSLTN